MVEQPRETSSETPRRKGGTTRRFLAAMMKLPDTAITKLVAATARPPAGLEGLITDMTTQQIREQLKISGVFDRDGMQRTSVLETRNALSSAIRLVPETKDTETAIEEELVRYFAAKIGLNISFGV